MWRHPHHEAFERLAPLRAALDRARLPRYTLDATEAVIRARAIASRLAPFREAIARLPDFDVGHLDRLTDLADALEYVHALLNSLPDPARAAPALVAEATPLRALLMKYADVLVMTGTFAPDVVARLRLGAGRLDLCEDLSVLSLLYGQHPEVIGPGAPVTVEHVTRAHALGVELGLAVVAPRGDPERKALLKERAKIAHLLLTARGQLHRAMLYLRYEEGDAARLVPPLHAPRRRRAGGG